jgi:hypothetical protein
LFGQNRTVELRNSARIVQSVDSLLLPLTRSLAHICVEIVRYYEISKVGSNPVRVATALSYQPAWKFASRRTWAGSVISAGTLLMVETTISRWRAPELISLSRIRIARESLELRNSARVVQMVEGFWLTKFRKAIRAKVKNTCSVARIVSLMSYSLPLTAV